MGEHYFNSNDTNWVNKTFKLRSSSDHSNDTKSSNIKLQEPSDDIDDIRNCHDIDDTIFFEPKDDTHDTSDDTNLHKIHSNDTNRSGAPQNNQTHNFKHCLNINCRLHHKKDNNINYISLSSIELSFFIIVVNQKQF